MEYNYAMIDKHFIDYIISIAGPSAEQDELRLSKCAIIKKVISNAFINEPDVIVHTFSFGSFPFKSYHRDSDMDITVILIDRKTNKLISSYTVEYLNHVISLIENSIRTYYAQCCIEEPIERIDADVRLIKCKFEGISFDISINNFVGLFKLIFMHYIETNYLDIVFYKRTLLLIKAWCYYEGTILGSNIGLLGSYALEILVIYMFNNYSHLFNDELGAFFTFFYLMSQINWENQILTIYGLYDITQLTNYKLNLENLLKDTKPFPQQKITHTAIMDFTKQFERFNDLEKVQNFNVNKKVLMIGKYSMHIIDPIYNTNNLAKSVNVHNYSRIKELFTYMYIQCNDIQKAKEVNALKPNEYLNTLLGLFSKVVIANNTELFRLCLPEPKIIIVPTVKGSGTGVDGVNGSKKDDSDSSSSSETMFQSFNKKFIKEGGNTSSNNVNSCISNSNSNVSMKNNNQINTINKVNGMLWPSSVEISDENILIDYANNNINNVNYITNDILEFVNRNMLVLSNGGSGYDFKTEDEVTDIEAFEKAIQI